MKKVLEKMNVLKKTDEKKILTMTEGSIGKQILVFAIPLLIGNLFQQLYNTVDSVIVGQYVGKQALAAVGSSVSLINLMIGLLIGISTGAGILIAQYYGAKNKEKLHWAIHTAIMLSIIGGIILSIVGGFLANWLLKLMDTPPEVMPSSTTYLRIFFLGSLFNLVYNMGAGILRAVGDSKSPLYFLIIASITNIVLDIVFVVVFKLGVAGVGFATIIAQGVSACLVIKKLVKSDEMYRLELKKIKIDKRMAKRIISLGIPSGLQSSVVSLSNVVVQANINSFGETVMAGCSSYSKIDGFVMLPIMSFSMAAMTFVGQNIGAGKSERAKKGLFVSCGMGFVYVLIASGVLFLFGENILKIFSDEKDVIYYGMLMLRILAPFYVLIAWGNIICGAFRGAGKSLSSMAIMVINLCGVRMLWVNIMTPIYKNIESVLWGYPVTWITCFICCLIYALRGTWINTKQL